MPVVPIRWVLVRDPLRRFEPQALLCTGLACALEQILRWFVQRWQIEVTLQETSAHLGVEIQRQWSDLAIARTTPCLLGLFSIVTLLADWLNLTSDGVRRQQRGIESNARRSATSLLPCVARSRKNRVCSCPGARPPSTKPRLEHFALT